MQLALITVNAFASTPFTGNPAAVTLLDHWLDGALMQAIAAQNKLAETPFLVKTAPATYQIRFFAPADGI